MVYYGIVQVENTSLRRNPPEVRVRGRGIEWSLRAFASMRAVRLFLRARAVINFLMRAESTSSIFRQLESLFY